MISPLFTTIVVLGAFIWIYMKATSKNIGKSSEELLEREALANSVRRQPIDNLDYINFTESSIPFMAPAPNDRIDSLQETLRSLTVCKILNLTGITNTDLKMTYGPANLPVLTQYDQNFTLLARTLYDLAIELISIDLKDEAIKVLNYGVSIGTDISSNYVTLANLYVETGRSSEIKNLINSAESIRSITKNSTIKKLQEIMDTNSTMVIARPSSDASSEVDPGSILPADILDILETVPYISDDQK